MIFFLQIRLKMGNLDMHVSSCFRFQFVNVTYTIIFSILLYIYVTMLYTLLYLLEKAY